MKSEAAILERLGQSATIESAEVVALRRMIESDAYAAHQGAAEQKALYDAADYQGWWPTTSDRRFGAMARAEEARADKAAQERQELGRGAWGALAGFGL